MNVHADNPECRDWMRYDADGRLYVTNHMGWTPNYEGYLNSPLRDQIRASVGKVVSDYPMNLMYFDGPYEGMDQRQRSCHCQHCQGVYQKTPGKSIPLQKGAGTREDNIEKQR
jgi:hypothetical protein